LKAAYFIPPLILLIVTAIAAPCYSATIKIEAESYTSYKDTAGNRISFASNSECSGGFYLFGLDYTNEWVSYTVPISGYSTYKASMYLRGDLGVEYNLRLELTPVEGGFTQTTYFNFIGLGFG
jgi:hypothetical protein